MSKKALPKLLQEAKELNISHWNCMKKNKCLKKQSMGHGVNITMSSLEMTLLHVQNAWMNLKHSK